MSDPLFLSKKFKTILFIMLIFCFNISYALPFSIIPKTGTTLPTSVNIGDSTNAYYTVKNLSSTMRSNNHVTYLPLNTTQVTNGATYPDTCSSAFTLNANESCTLQLKVNGKVDAHDPDPHHHLFVTPAI